MQGLDAEWMELIITAKQLGLSKDDVRGFLNFAGMYNILYKEA